MKRKVNLVGQNTLTVSLPKKWVEKNNIKKGDEIEVVEDELSIIITRGQYKKSKSISLDLKDAYFEPVKTHENIIRTVIGSLYKNGYEEMTLHINNPQEANQIQKRTNLLMGMEVISTSKDICVIKSVLDANLQEYDSIFRKYTQIILNKSKEIETSLKTGELLPEEDIDNYRLSIEKLSDFLEHLLSKDMTQDHNILFNKRIIIVNLEKAARGYIHLYNYINANKIKKVDPEIISYLRETNQMLEKYINHYYKFKNDDIPEFANIKNNMLYKKGYSLIINGDKKQAPIIYHLLNIVRRIWDCEGPTISYNLLSENTK